MSSSKTSSPKLPQEGRTTAAASRATSRGRARPQKPAIALNVLDRTVSRAGSAGLPCTGSSHGGVREGEEECV
eukprot:9370312-Pyramimonas_sp.AAC.1